MSRKPAPEAAAAARWATAHRDRRCRRAAGRHGCHHPRSQRSPRDQTPTKRNPAPGSGGACGRRPASRLRFDCRHRPYSVSVRAQARGRDDACGQRASVFHPAGDAVPLVHRFPLREGRHVYAARSPLPAGYFVPQSVAIEDVAARLLRAIDEGPAGLLLFGGPERLTAHEAADLAGDARCSQTHPAVSTFGCRVPPFRPVTTPFPARYRQRIGAT